MSSMFSDVPAFCKAGLQPPWCARIVAHPPHAVPSMQTNCPRDKCLTHPSEHGQRMASESGINIEKYVYYIKCTQ